MPFILAWTKHKMTNINFIVEGQKVIYLIRKVKVAVNRSCIGSFHSALEDTLPVEVIRRAS